MTALLLVAESSPVVRVWLVHGGYALDVYAPVVFVVGCYLCKILRKISVLVIAEIVLARVFCSRAASAVGHIVGGRVGEHLDYHIVARSFDTLAQHVALVIVGVPVVCD